MSDYLGLIFTGVGTIIFVLNDPWKRQIWKTKFTLGNIGILLLIAGVVISFITTRTKNAENLEYKNRLETIDTTLKNTFSTTTTGFELMLKEYENQTSKLIKDFSENYDTLISTVINQSDSALNSQLSKIEKDYSKLNNEFIIQRDIAQRYYYSEQWPYSDKREYIGDALFYFIPIHISGLVSGKDRYVIWYLIEKNGSFPYNQIDKLHDEMWAYLKPMSLSLGTNLKKLELLQIIKPNYWKGEVEFTENFEKRLESYLKYKKDEDRDLYIRTMFKLERESRYN